MTLEADYRDFRDNIRRFAQTELAPRAAELDRSGEPPHQVHQAAAKLGIPGLPYPESYGGGGADIFAQCVAMEEMARACASSALSLGSSWILSAVVDFGSKDQQDRIVPQMVAGEARSAWGLTEPKGGSDLMAASTKATRTGDGWIINGVKRFITNGGWADWYMVFARTSEKRFGLFLVNKADPGVSFGAREKKMGMRASPTSDVILDNVIVPEWRLLGDPERGAEYINKALLKSRMQMSAHALGIAGAALTEALRYTKERVQFGQPVAEFQLVRGLVADMAIKVEAARATLRSACELYIGGDPAAKTQASIAKVLCSDAAMAVTTDAVQLHGGYGYLQDYPVERMMRDAKVTQIWEGTNQIHRLMIAKDFYERV
ncbi:acyl-CoA dehydrogenase domain protein [Rhodopseudomonas palustris TIE-1]|uniref:acyl-CoA dehydrogenase family protein n=1 Tax=Rhodopseudomonas palustris TaxID=1076 RepID=UPI000164B9DB|nr:acyl-CoA dehydrogenase family protein [Rhodopseudomonas palustris]ACF00085.1 acyl-CoA dehydrogenase domain protein [Rhodopseudomonas palustris TIE-1]